MRPILLTKQEAAEALSISMDSLERYVQPKVRTVRVGRSVLIPLTQLRKWVKESSA